MASYVVVTIPGPGAPVGSWLQEWPCVGPFDARELADDYARRRRPAGGTWHTRTLELAAAPRPLESRRAELELEPARTTSDPDELERLHLRAPGEPREAELEEPAESDELLERRLAIEARELMPELGGLLVGVGELGATDQVWVECGWTEAGGRQRAGRVRVMVGPAPDNVEELSEAERLEWHPATRAAVAVEKELEKLGERFGWERWEVADTYSG